jgi:type IV pilus assembly protein PilW
MGFGNISAQSLGCTVKAHNSGFATPSFEFKFVPVEIVDGTGGLPDVIRVLYGNSAYVVNIQKVQSSTATSKTLQYRTGFNAGDAILVAGNTPRDCALFEVTGNSAADAVTILHGTTSYTNFYTAAAVMPTLNSATAGATFTSGEIYNFGPNAQRTQWQLSAAGVLTRMNSLRTTTPSEVSEGLVNIQAQYGYDGADAGAGTLTGGTVNGRIEATEWIDNFNGATPDWTKVLAVRVAILARSGQLEKDAITANAPSWAGGNFVMLNLDGTVGASAVLANDWKRYRYKVYETLVPLRNMMWGATS